MQHLRNFAQEYGKKITYHNSKVIFQVGERPSHFYWLEEGYVKMFYEAASGQATTLSLFKPGEFFGMAELFSKKDFHEYSAIGLGQITIYAVTLEQLSNALTVDSSLWPAVTQVFAHKMMDAHQQIMKLTNLSVPERLAAFLQQYAVTDTSGQLVVDIPLSHEEISFIINCSRQKVTSYLNLWRKEGFISYERGNIQIRQPDEIFQ